MPDGKVERIIDVVAEKIVDGKVIDMDEQERRSLPIPYVPPEVSQFALINRKAEAFDMFLDLWQQIQSLDELIAKGKISEAKAKRKDAPRETLAHLQGMKLEAEEAINRMCKRWVDSID
jgi:hypothetical protein